VRRVVPEEGNDVSQIAGGGAGSADELVTGVVVSIAGWMLDPVVCVAMAMGAPRVDLATLVELKRLLIGASKPTHCRSDAT